MFAELKPPNLTRPLTKVYGVLVPRVSWQSGWSINKHGSINPVGIVEDGNDDFNFYS